LFELVVVRLGYRILFWGYFAVLAGVVWDVHLRLGCHAAAGL